MKKILYLGTDPSSYKCEGQIIHYPVIKIVPRNNLSIKVAYSQLSTYTHLLFSSKNAVQVFFQQLDRFGISKKFLEKITISAIGTVTASHVKKYAPCHFIAEEETQEGMVALLKLQSLENAQFFFPRSSLSRNVIIDFFQKNNILFQDCFIYDTVVQKNQPVPNLEEIDEIVFTSPSTIRAFLEIFPVLPLHKKLLTIGPITQKTLDTLRGSNF
ncbi:MAG: uroporphyrinogen-III synthase [Candidatus Rhabdochlamydia sp.]